MTRSTDQGRWPGEPDDEYPDYLWPDEDDEAHGNEAYGNEAQDSEAHSGGAYGGVPDARDAGGSASLRAGGAGGEHVSSLWMMPRAQPYAPPVSRRRRSVLALAGTAVLACGLGAGAMLAYRAALPAPVHAAAPSRGTELLPARSPGPAGQGAVEEVAVAGRVLAVGSGSVTIGGPGRPLRATVTNATRFTGAVRTLAGVRVGDIVAAQIRVANGALEVVTLQDPASEP